MSDPSEPSEDANQRSETDSRSLAARAAQGKVLASENMLLVAEQSRKILTGVDVALQGVDRRPAAVATDTSFSDLPGVDAALLKPLQALPSPVTLEDAARDYAPMVHAADLGASGSRPDFPTFPAITKGAHMPTLTNNGAGLDGILGSTASHDQNGLIGRNHDSTAKGNSTPLTFLE